MTDTIEIMEKTEERLLTLNDRCDSCGAAAYVQVKGVTGELLFCAHHYNKIQDNEVAREKMEAFAFEIIDERWSLLGENRAKGES